MLTADHVRVRRSGGELFTVALDARAKSETLEIADACLRAARSLVGQRRSVLEDAWDAVAENARDARLAAGIRKLVEDACAFEAETEISPVDVRKALFTRAAEVRRTRTDIGPVDRNEVVREVAASLSLDPPRVERALFADLRNEHLVVGAPTENAETILEAYELGQAQAVLLRAVRVTCEIRAASPGLLRSFFARLKFHQLLFSAERIEAGYRVVIDGPFSMFEAVTKYGVRLAMLLPALRTLDAWSLVADVRWGKDREPLVFRLSGGSAGGSREPSHVSAEVSALKSAIVSQKGPWKAKVATAILDLPGVGVCIPDLVLQRDDAPPVYVEVMGFWSRDAVFRRAELAARGLGARIIFAVSARLRVSAEVLGPEELASLYVYKGKMSARALLTHADRLATMRSAS